MLIRNGICFLQGYEVESLLFFADNRPGDVLYELVKNHGRKLLLGDFGYPYGFNFYLKEKANVEWAKRQTWLLDYDSYTNDDADELLREQTKALREVRELINDKITKKIYVTDEQTYRGVIAEDIMRSRALRALVDYREGRVIFIFPNEFQQETPQP